MNALHFTKKKKRGGKRKKELCIDSWEKKEGCLKRKGRQSGQNEELSLSIMSMSFYSSRLFIHSQHNNAPRGNMFPLLHYSYWGGGGGGRGERKPSHHDRGNKIP